MALVNKTRISTTPSSSKQLFYRDFLSNLNTSYDSDDLIFVENDDAVKSALRNLIFTAPGERPYNNDFGCNLKYMLFEPITPQTEQAILTTIKNTISSYEPRIKLIDVVVSGAIDDNAYNVTITYATINTKEPEVIDFILRRVR